MNHFLLRLCMSLVVLLLSQSVNAGQESVGSDLRAEGRLLLSKGDVAEIERVAEHYRTTKQRTPAGFWALYYFYDGMTDVSSKAPDDARWDEAEQLALKWHQKNPQSATAIIVYAKLLDKHAWAYRGDGYIDSVTEKGGNKFAEYLRRAAKFLDENREIGTQDPNWYSERIAVANGQGVPKDELFKLALQGLDKYPTYYTIHFVMANALLPKWHGNFDLIKRYATLAVAHSEMAGEGTQAYARFYFSVSLGSKNRAGEVYVPDVDWPRLKQSLDEIYRAFPDPWTLNLQRVMGCAFGTSVDCKHYLEQLHEQYMSIAWYDTPKWQKDCEDWALHGKSFSKAVNADVKAPTNYVLLYILFVLIAALGFAFVDIRSRRLRAEREAAAKQNAANGV